MRKLITVFFILTGFIYAQEKTFTLEESLQTGIVNSKELKISKADLVSSEANLSEQTSNLLPDLSFNASYTRLSDIKPFEIYIPAFGQTLTVQEPILDNYTFKLSLQQPLFTGFRLTSLRDAAKYQKKAAQAEYDKDINEEAYNIYTAFWNYYKAQQILTLINENLKSLSEHLEDTRNFLENGLVTRNDLLKIEVEYANTRVKKIEAENNLKLAQASFNKAIGLELSRNTGIDADAPDSTALSANFNELLNTAFTNRQELKITQYQINANKENIDAASSSFFPSVYLFGNYYYSRPNQRIMPAEDKFYDTWDAGVSLQWELWNWGGTSAKVTQAKQQKIKAETSYNIIKENIELEVYNNYLKTISEYDKVQLNKKTVEQAEENYRITKNKYNDQLSTSTDLIDAEVMLLDAQTNLTNALVDLELAKVRLSKSVGLKIY